MIANLIWSGSLLLIFVALIFTPYLFQRNKTKKLEGYAQRKGLLFDPYGYHILPENLNQFYIFGKKHVSHRNVIYGEYRGHQLFVFDVIQPSRKSKIPRTQTAILFVSPSIDLPHFTLLPKHTFVWSHPVFGDNFLEIKEDNQFDSLYLLQGESPTIVHNLFDDRIRAHFVNLVNKSCEGKGAQFLYYYDGHWYDPSRLDVFIEEGFEAFELFHSKKYADATG
jgi:hypothetical protein